MGEAALKVDLDGDGHAARKFFNLSERYSEWRDYRVDPHGRGLHGISLYAGRGRTSHTGRGRSAPRVERVRQPGISPSAAPRLACNGCLR